MPLRNPLSKIFGLRQAVGEELFLLGALAAAILGQSALTPQPLLTQAILLVILVLYIYALLANRRNIARRVILGLVLALGFIFFATLPLFLRALAFFALAILLFLLAIKSQGEVKAKYSQPFTWGEFLLLTGTLSLAFLLLAYDLENIPPGMHGDEGEVGMQALAILQGRVTNLIGAGWYDQPLLGFLWPAITMAIFGDTLFGLRMASVLSGVLTLIPTYFLSRLLFGRRVASLAVLLMALGHWFIGLDRIGVNYSQSMLLETTAIYFLFRARQSRHLGDWAISGVLVGTGLYFYYASRLVPVLFLAYFIILAFMERGFGREKLRGIALLFLIALLVFLPQGIYFFTHPRQFLSRTQFIFLYSNPQTTAHFTGTADPLAALMVQSGRLLALFNFGFDYSGQYGYKGPMLDFLSAAFLVLGLAYTLARWRDPRFLFLSLWCIMTLSIGGVLTLPAPFTPRLVGMMPAVYIIVAIALDQTISRIGLSHPRPVLSWGVFLSMALISFSNYEIYFLDYIHSLDGWAQYEPATAVAKYIRERREDYFFYLLGQPRLYLRHGTIRFLARNYQGINVENPTDVIPLHSLPAQNVAYILLPEYLQYLPMLRIEYSQGQEETYLRSDGQIWFVAYEVPREEIERVLTGEN